MSCSDGVCSIAQSSVYATDRAKSLCVIGLVAYDLLKFLSSAGKRGTSCRFVPAKPGGKTTTPTVRKWDVFVVAPAGGHRCQRAFGCSRVALATGQVEPLEDE